jgi:hypothetical protein
MSLESFGDVLLICSLLDEIVNPPVVGFRAWGLAFISLPSFLPVSLVSIGFRFDLQD